MKDSYILALDQGTTSSRAIVFDNKGAVRGMAQAEFAQIYPQAGWVEHDPIEIYSSLSGVMSEALVRAGVNRKDVAAIGITNQRETVVVWERSTGKPVYNAIVWQCRRTTEFCDKLKKEGLENAVYTRTGLPIDAYFSASKLKWVLDNVPNARQRAERGELLFGTVDTYIIWKLTAGKVFATDYTNASRTMLFNIHTLDWDDELLSIFNIPRCMLAKVYPSGHLYGYTDETVFGEKIPIAGVAGDQQAALFGQLCWTKGTIKNTFGTGCFLLMNVGDKPVDSKRGLITTLAATTGAHDYVLEGSVFMGGAVVQWLRDEMRMIKSAAETETYATRVSDTLGVYIVPAFVGLGAPHWDPYARGTVTGLTRGVKKEHFIRAALEGIDYQVFDVLHAMERECGVKVKRLAVDGGATANNFLMQFMADITNAEVVRPAIVETTALGVCYLAGLTVGLWKENEIRRLSRGETVFAPIMKEEQRLKLIEGWEQAVQRAKRR